MQLRRPAALVPSPLARLAGYALLAVVGALQWIRYVDGASTVRALAWAATGTATGALVLLARGRPLRTAGAVLIGAALAIAASGLDLTYLAPRHLDDLVGGLNRGAAALNTVRLPYLGKEPWVLVTVNLTGAGVCWLAAILAMWPRHRAMGAGRIGALVLLLILIASPIVSLGAGKPVLLGLMLAGLTAVYLWLERLARRPGLGAIVLGAAVVLAAIPLGAAADQPQPWFNYKAFSERISGGTPISFTWNHDYGPITWTRNGAELFRVKAKRPFYWKADVLNTFEDNRWDDNVRTSLGGDTPSVDLPVGGNPHHEWDTTFEVGIRRLKTPTVIGAGTVTRVSDATEAIEPDYLPGMWVPQGGKVLSKGDSYVIHAHVPNPTPAQLARATVGRDPRRAPSLTLLMGIRPDAINTTPSIPDPLSSRPVHQTDVAVDFAPYEEGKAPTASYAQLGLTGSGTKALKATLYERTWQLAQRLKAQSTSAYDYVLRVNNLLRGPDFGYTEDPPVAPPNEAPLEYFLFHSKRGFCQQYSGAMALLLRMGGVPARVATGFSPGGLRASSGEWVVRDTDAHSWVEAWFDGIGWVTFDPTPPATPARSQIAAINPPTAKIPGRNGQPNRATPLQRNPRSNAFNRNGPSVGASGGAHAGGFPWATVLLVAVLLAIAAAVAVALRRAAVGLSTPEAALLEVERALRRSGRAAPTGTTLIELDRRLGTSSTGYLGALRAARYRPTGAGPSPSQRAAFRRELSSGLGWAGRLRGYWALPPQLPPIFPSRKPR